MNRRTKRRPTPTMDAIMAHAAKLKGTQRANAEALGISFPKLQRLLDGERPAALADLDAMAKALGLVISVEYRPPR